MTWQGRGVVEGGEENGRRERGVWGMNWLGRGVEGG